MSPVDQDPSMVNNIYNTKREDSRNTYNQNNARGPSDERDMSMQDMRNGSTQVRFSQKGQKKSIKKTESPTGSGSCFSFFSCCNKPSSVTVEQRIESKSGKSGKKVSYNNEAEIHD